MEQQQPTPLDPPPLPTESAALTTTPPMDPATDPPHVEEQPLPSSTINQPDHVESLTHLPKTTTNSHNTEEEKEEEEEEKQQDIEEEDDDKAATILAQDPPSHPDTSGPPPPAVSSDADAAPVPDLPLPLVDDTPVATMDPATIPPGPPPLSSSSSSASSSSSSDADTTTTTTTAADVVASTDPVAAANEMEGTRTDQGAQDETIDTLNAPPHTGAKDTGGSGSAGSPHGVGDVDTRDAPTTTTTTKEREEKEEEEEKQKVKDLPPPPSTLVDRHACIASIKAAYTQLESLRYQHLQWQSKISDLFRKRRSEDKSLETDKSVMDQEKRYSVIMAQYKQILTTYNELKKVHATTEGDLRSKLEAKKIEVSDRVTELLMYRRQIALTSEHSRTGKSIPLKVVEQLEAMEEKKAQHVALVRLENIKLRNKLKRHEHILHQKEELAEGLHLIDFEQLKIENQTYNEKIEERNEELLKLRKKITNVVQVLAHIKEKLEFVQVENKELNQTLKELDTLVAHQRDGLPHYKQKREALRKSNIFLKQKHGLLGNEPLLRDFEERVDECEALENQIQSLEKMYEKINAHTKLLALEEQNLQRFPQLLQLS